MKKRLPFIKEQVMNNWVYKAVALLVAVAIWATMLHGRKDVILERHMDIEFILKPSLVIANAPDRVVRVKVSGPRNALKKLGQLGQTITVNLVQAEPGRKRVEIRPSDVALPTGVKLLSISPSYLELEIREVKKP